MTSTRWKKITIASAVVVIVLLVIGLLVNVSKNKTEGNLGAFNPAINKSAPTAPLGEVGPGACLPARTFNNSNGTAEVVKYLSGHDPRDINHTASAVATRDVKWLTTHQSYYNYTPGQSDASWHQGLVLEKLVRPITVLDTYCPSGQNIVKDWRVETLPVGEWVWFLRGHGQKDGTNIVPVRKAVCGNFLLPPPPPPPAECKVRCHPTPTPVTLAGCLIKCHPTPVCVPPQAIPTGYAFNQTTCTLYKPPQSSACMLNGGPNCPPNGGNQPPQSNPCCYTGPTVNGSTPPSPAPTGPTPSPSSSAPPPNSGGYDSGSGSGSGTPQGSTCNSSGCSGGGSSSPSPGPTDTANSGNNSSGSPPPPS